MNQKFALIHFKKGGEIQKFWLFLDNFDPDFKARHKLDKTVNMAQKENSVAGKVVTYAPCSVLVVR